MKATLPTLLAAALVCSSGNATAQQPDIAAEAAQRAAMAKLAWMDGLWRGPAVTQTSTGEHRVTQTERIGPMLGGTLKVLEGKGFNPDASVGFNAFAILSYNFQSKAYVLHSYSGGRVGDFPLTPTPDGYVWEIPAGLMTIRYTATLKDGLWNEVGDQIAPGRPPQRFFEMNLRRVGDSRWPAGDGPKPD